MTLWACLFTLAYIPGWLGSALQSGWAYICLTVPWMGLYATSRLPRWVKAGGLVAFGWALFSCFRLRQPWLGGEQMMQLFSVGLVANLASKQPNLQKIVRGLAIGLSLGTLAALWYAVGWGSEWHDVVPTFGKPAGFFYNSIIFGDACAFVILLLLAYGDYLWIPLLALGLYLSDSRGAGLALVIGVVCWIGQDRRWVFALLGCIALPIGMVATRIPFSDSLRLIVWQHVYDTLSWLGHGPGWLETVALRIQGRLYVIEYAHNEFLDLAGAYGIGAILFVLLLVAPLALWRRPEWPAYVAFLSACVWSFPLHYPPEAIIGALVAGAMYPHWSLSWSSILRCRQPIYVWAAGWQHRFNPGWRGYLPLLPRTVE